MKKALISVTNKKGIVEFAGKLHALGFELLSTGGTYQVLMEGNIPVRSVEHYTQMKEMLDGRVKTLHPLIHGGILYRRDNPGHLKSVEENSIEAIDLVCVNLYDFENALSGGKDEAGMIEEIDIGGPTLVRAASKNFKDVLIVTDPDDYEAVVAAIEMGADDYAFRRHLAGKAFTLTARYDALISGYFRKDEEAPEHKVLPLDCVKELSYGENPHQKGYLYKEAGADASLLSYEQLGGKGLSYNNLGDLYGGLTLLSELSAAYEDKKVCVAIKHGTPCGAAIGNTLDTAYDKAKYSDPLSIFGGVVLFDDVVDKGIAEKITSIFLEVIGAPAFTEEALEILGTKKNMRILKLTGLANIPKVTYKYLDHYFLLQEEDLELYEGLEVVTQKEPSRAEKEDMIFGMIVAKALRSNGIAIVKDGGTLGLCGGQTSRIYALKNAITNHEGERDFTGAVMASDGFFPFSDCVEYAAQQGIQGIIQPGGSKNDSLSIEASDSLGLFMVLSHRRHFKH